MVLMSIFMIGNTTPLLVIFGSRFEINLIECQFDAIENPHMLIVFKTGFHYDAIVPISLLVARTDQCTKSTSFESVRASHCASNVSQACNVPTIEPSVIINVSSRGDWGPMGQFLHLGQYCLYCNQHIS